ncbi:MAG TPA: hydrogenase maturation nickel metallochaperone HypA [Anaerolineales bacterium]|nr:hydrogenase maturation nickel metallochaperone HypA [Anaerolineales bacterium]
MQNLLIAQSLLKAALAQAQKASARRITAMHILLGELSDADEQAIRSSWDVAAKGSIAENASLKFQITLAEVQCMTCFETYQPKDRKLTCPYCRGVGAKILSGEGCVLASAEME